jgi:hypothetical protein
MKRRERFLRHDRRVIEAADWLRAYLAKGPAKSAAVKSAAAQTGIGRKTLQLARERLGITIERQASFTVWSLPDAAAEFLMENSVSGSR